MAVYPPKIKKRLESLQTSGRVDGENAFSKDASFICGCFVRFSLRIDDELKMVADAGFETNGCGYMTALADCLAAGLVGRPLSDLHGLDDQVAGLGVERQLGPFEPGRDHCRDSCRRALRQAFAGYRLSRIEEFRGEKALVCTCFGVTEEAIETAITARSLRTLDEVMQVCRAGSGCGSCRMLIEEMLGEGQFNGP